jgi:uncharacterized protein YaiE (UPF0345 family)
MGSKYIAPFGELTVDVPASGKVAAYSLGEYEVLQIVGYPNQPPQQQVLFSNKGAYTSAAFTLAGQAVINAGPYPVLVNVGTSASVYERSNYQPTPGALNSTGALTADLMLGRIVTSTTASAVTATIPTGAVMETALDMDVGDSFDWSAVNTGSNAFTVTGASGHTVEGAGAVAAGSSGLFRTRKTAASTFVTSRIG